MYCDDNYPKQIMKYIDLGLKRPHSSFYKQSIRSGSYQ